MDCRQLIQLFFLVLTIYHGQCTEDKNTTQSYATPDVVVQSNVRTDSLLAEWTRWTSCKSGQEKRYRVRLSRNQTACSSCITETKQSQDCHASTKTTTMKNLALHKPVAASSIFHSRFPTSLVVDGNTDNNFYAGSCMHTDLDQHPWLRIDLKPPYQAAVNQVVIFNRGDAWSSRIRNLTVTVGDDAGGRGNELCGDVGRSMGNEGKQGSKNAYNTMHWPCTGLIMSVLGKRVFVIDCVGGSAKGRYVHVAVPGPQYLHLCEVQVLGYNVIPGTSKYTPAPSCKWLHDHFKAELTSGWYWIKVRYPTKLYCDMDGAEGGWTQIANLVSTGNLIPIMDVLRESPFCLTEGMIDGNYALSHNGVRILKEGIGARQFRVYCHKPSVGRTVHVATEDNGKGRAVLDYFSGLPSTNTSDDLPASCGSFRRLSDDNSTLSTHCSEWNWGIKSGTWGYHHHWTQQTRIYSYTMFIGNRNHVYINDDTRNHLCDDVENGERIYTGVWKYYIR